ncbi:cell wall-binding repeat-containing protein [Clostridium lundense]|uniref:cell wall-binding repeat-containing protein n=1 Tax=Clostridium lundense TaxID=319475 RepID=UPI000686974D|nr:cell wall-binding repeat-containing protein [Clostridium lundense]
MIKNNKWLMGLMCAAMISTLSSSKVYASPEKNRIYGLDRYETSAKVAEEGWNTSQYAIIASGQNFPDSLSAVTLAKKYDAPILLTNQNYLNFNVEKELKRMNVKKVFIIGGLGSVSYTVENSIKAMGISIERLGGKDRYETCVKIANKLGNPSSIFLVTSDYYTDALSVGPIAAKKGFPILLVPKNYTPNSIKEYVKRKKFNKIYVVGSSNIISDNVLREFEDVVQDYESNIERIPGSSQNEKSNDVYERNLNLIAKFEDELNLYKNIYVTSGKDFPDALSVSALAAKKESPIIIANPKDNNLLKSFISKKYNDIQNMNIIGGQGVMPDGYLSEVNGYFKDKEIAFTDENLNNAVREKLGIENKNKKIYKSDVKGITSLDLTGYRIKDLTGIGDLTSLKELNLSNNQIEDISPLKDMTSLQNLNLSKNKIRDIKKLEGLYDLESLNLSKNNVRDIDYLEKNTRLKYLNLSVNDVSSVSKLEKLTRLEFLDLSNNTSLNGLSNISKLTNLTSLKLSHTRISSLSFLKDLVNLTELDLSKNNIGSVSDLAKLKKLKTLYLNDNTINNIEDLKDLKNLKELNLWKNKIDDVKDLKNLTSLEKLTIDNELLNSSNKDDLTILSVKYKYYKDTYLGDYADPNNYYDNVESNENDSRERELEDEESNDLKQQLISFERMYGHTYNPQEIIYTSYLDDRYTENIDDFIQRELELDNYMKDNSYSVETKAMIKKDFKDIVLKYSMLEKNHQMNEKVKILEMNLKTSLSEKEKRKVRNNINYTYADYRFDFYKNANYVCERKMQEIQGTIEGLKLDGSYANNERIRELEGELRNKRIEYDIIKNNYEKYSNYRNFFAVVDSLLSE